MIFYVFPSVVVYIYSIYVFTTKKPDKYNLTKLLIILSPALLVAALRGNIGVDTENYTQHFSDKINNITDSYTFEVGFEKLIEIFVYLKLSVNGIFASIATIITVLLSLSFSRNKNSILLFLLVLFPLYYVDSTMNGIRYGLAFSIASIAIDLLYKKNNPFFILMFIIASSIQISSTLIFLSFLLAKFNWKVLSFLLLISLIYSPEFTEFILPYLIDKKDAYIYSYSPSFLSGIFPLIVFLILYTLFLFNFKKPLAITEIHVLLILEILAFVLAKYSYAGLRCQLLFLFSLLLAIKNNLANNILNESFYKALFILSLILHGNFLKNLLTGVAEFNSTYLPYEFFWQ